MLKFLGRLAIKLFFRCEFQGRIPDKPDGKLLILANHQSFLDPALVAALLPFDVYWITHTTIAAQWHFRIILRFVPHIVVDTTNPMAMKQVVQEIDAGKPVVIFPEGRLTVTGSLMKVYDGLAFLQARTGAKILPIAIDGAVFSRFTRAKPRLPKLWRPRVRVTYFPVRELPPPEGRSSRERRRAASNQIRRMLEETWFLSRKQTSLFETFLDSVELFGRGWEIADDIRFQPQTYGMVLRGALALGRLVSRLSREGEILGVLMPNAAPTIMLLFGMFCVRRVPAMLNYTSGVDGMQSAIDAAGIKTIVASRTFLEKAKLVEKVAQLRGVQVVLLEDLRPTFGLLDKVWLMLWAMRFPRSVMVPTKPSDPAFVLFTSGSEGKPKGVVVSHKGILSNIDQVRSVFEFSAQDKFLAALPLFHSFGLTVGALVPLVTGARVFLYPSPLHYRMIPEMAYDQDCTVLFGTGTFLAKYARMAHPYDLYSVRYVLSGAERLPDSVRQTYLEKFGIRIHEGYGVTECSPAVSVTTPYFHRVGTVGRLLPGMEHRITPVPGIAAGGMLHVRGPNLMLGYLKVDQPGVLQPPSSSVGEGWYETGDIVEIDADGFVRIVARVKRFAKVAGEMVSLEVVEQMAAIASPNRAHAATTVSSERRGEVIVLFSEDRDLKRDALLAAARSAGLPEVAVPRIIHNVDKLTRLGSGKVDYLTLKDTAAKLAAEPDQVMTA
jgi:acyl-[acyl-carrier-protein]-phospholipid O-acyltransferase/long-chain-fatty-acid--[acyl-carrier-protein] ligase